MFTTKREIFRKYNRLGRSFRVLAYMVMRNLNTNLENHLFIDDFIERIQSINYSDMRIYSKAKSMCSHPGFITGFKEFEAALFLSITAQYSERYEALRNNKLYLYLEAFELIEQEVEKIYKNDDDLYKSMNLLYNEALKYYCKFSEDFMSRDNIFDDFEIDEYDDEDDFDEPFDYTKTTEIKRIRT